MGDSYVAPLPRKSDISDMKSVKSVRTVSTVGFFGGN
jgi:hypothetical protein